MSTDFFEGFLSLDFSCRALTSWMTWEEIDLALKASTWSELKSFCGFLSHYKFALNIVTNMYPFIPHIWSDRKWRRLWPDPVKLDQPWPLVTSSIFNSKVRIKTWSVMIKAVLPTNTNESVSKISKFHGGGGTTVLLFFFIPSRDPCHADF